MQQAAGYIAAGRTMFGVGLRLKERAAPEQVGPPGKLETQTVPNVKRPRIRCPHCQWQPERGSRWMCASSGAPEFFDRGCGQVWNTFDTRGICPGCSYQWKHTACLACTRWALHEDWYESGNRDDPR